MGMLTNKSLIITTAIMCAITLLITTVPTFIVWFGSNDTDENPSGGTEVTDEFVLVYESQELKDAISPIMGKEAYATEEELKQAVQNEEVSSGFVIKDFNSYKYISYDRSLNSSEQWNFEAKLKQVNENQLFAKSGLDIEQIREILNQPIEQESIVLGKDASSGMAIAFIIIFVMYMLILLYGNNVATSVAREKDSRTMELLITSTKPSTLILGKVAAAGLTGIIQITSMILFAVIGFILNKVNYPEALDRKSVV